MTVVALNAGRGAGGRQLKLAMVVASVSNGDSITTGLLSVTGAVVCHNASTDIGASASAFDATVRSISGGTVTVTVISRTTGPALAAYDTDANVACIAWGS